MTTQTEPFEGWVIIDQLGHRRHAGYMSEHTIAGAAFIRLDPPEGVDAGTQFISPTSVYQITPTTQTIARVVAASAPKPILPWTIRTIINDEAETVRVQEISGTIDEPPHDYEPDEDQDPDPPTTARPTPGSIAHHLKDMPW